jgi:hypothetical protein
LSPKSCTHRSQDQNRAKLKHKHTPQTEAIPYCVPGAFAIDPLLVFGATERDAMLRWLAEVARKAIRHDGGSDDGTR